MSFFRNKGERYESLIEYVYQQLSLASDRDIDVKRNVKVTGKSGVEHQVDVYYEFEQNDVLHKVLIECKNHNKNVTKGMLQSFKAVLDDVSNSIGIFASYTGFQSGAIDFANHYGIELINGSETAMLSRTIIKNL